MFDDCDIREVEIGSFSGNCVGSSAVYDANGNMNVVLNLELNPDSVSTAICSLDTNFGKAINIDTGDIYDVLKKDKFNRIINDPREIKPNQQYVLSIGSKKILTSSELYNLYCNISNDNNLYKDKNINKKVYTKNRTKMVD